MIVIADTSPINYLILIGEIDVLPALYDRVLIPLAVHEELGRSRAPEAVRLWIARPPAWLQMRAPSRHADPSASHLDAGERDAILLAEEIHADLLIIDESRGRQEAKRRQLPFTGTLGVLRAGARVGLLDLSSAVARLRQTSFHIAQDVLDKLVKGEE